MLEGGHIHYLDDGCFMDIHICQSLLNCVFMCILLYVNYTSIKLSKNIGGNSMPFCPLEHLFIVL